MKQEKDGGEGSTNNQAGRDIVYNGLSVEQLDELKQHIDGQVVGEVERFFTGQMEVFREEFANFQGQAYEHALFLAQGLLAKVVEQLAANAPQNLDSIRTVPMQHAILNAQTSAAVVDDEELTDTLVDILIDKSGTEPRSFKGVVLTEALDVARKLTADQVNLLTALAILTRTITHNWDTPETILDNLDSRCRPLYGRIPVNDSATQYMAYTGVGDIERTTVMFAGRSTVADNIIRAYDCVFTTGFAVDDLPDDLKEMADRGDGMPPVDPRFGANEGNRRFRIASSQTIDQFADEGHLNEPYVTHKDAMKKLVSQQHLPVDKFMEIVDSTHPDLAKFIRGLDDISAAMFQLSTVGVALGQANWRRLQPESAPSVDIYLT
jgi:hypothetical protein